MLKKLLTALLQVKTQDELNELCTKIDRAYQSGKIRFDENELLYDIIARLFPVDGGLQK